MGVLRWIVFILVAIVAWYVAVKLYSVPPMPDLDPNPWWGPGEPREQNENIRPFKIDIPKEDVEDLKVRLMLSPRISPSLENVNFTYGVNSATMNKIVNYWTNEYDWLKGQQRLNAFKHFKTRIEGLNIHFMRASPPETSGKNVRPLLMVHGWPGSVFEFLDVLPLLTTPRADSDVVFEVICPSIPGYGFSDPSAKPGMNVLAVSQIYVKLMTRLGYDQFYVQGGDWGSVITTTIATAFPNRVIGVHLNQVFGINLGPLFFTHFVGSLLPSGFLVDSNVESKWYPSSKFYKPMLSETGYMHLQSTKPDTLGVALSNSPQGLAAYILEKFSTGTDMENINRKDGGLLDPKFPISLDKMLDNICLYWFTNSITTSMRFYAENCGSSMEDMEQIAKIPTSVPTGIAQFLTDSFIVPRRLAARKFTNIVSFTYPSNAGHFAAMEDPLNFSQDFFKFVDIVEAKITFKPDSNDEL